MMHGTDVVIEPKDYSLGNARRKNQATNRATGMFSVQ